MAEKQASADALVQRTRYRPYLKMVCPLGQTFCFFDLRQREKRRVFGADARRFAIPSQAPYGARRENFLPKATVY